MVTSFKRAYASILCLPGLLYSVPLTPQQATVNPHLHRDSWTLTGKSGSVSCGVTAPFSFVLVHIVTAASRRVSWRGGRVWQQEPYFRPHSRSWCWRLVSSLAATPGHTWPHLTSWTKCLRLDALASNSLLKATDHSVPISGHYVPSLFAFCTQVPVPTPCPSSK